MAAETPSTKDRIIRSSPGKNAFEILDGGKGFVLKQFLTPNETYGYKIIEFVVGRKGGLILTTGDYKSGGEILASRIATPEETVALLSYASDIAWPHPLLGALRKKAVEKIAEVEKIDGNKGHRLDHLWYVYHATIPAATRARKKPAKTDK